MCNCGGGVAKVREQRLRAPRERQAATVVRDGAKNPPRDGGIFWNGPQRRSPGTNGPTG